MKGPFKLKYNKSSFPFKEEEGNVIVVADDSAGEYFHSSITGVAATVQAAAAA